MSSSIRGIDQSLREVQLHLELSLRDRTPLDDAEVGALVTFHHNWLAQIAELRVSDERGNVMLGYGVTPDTRVNYGDRVFFVMHRDHDDGRTLASKLFTDAFPAPGSRSFPVATTIRMAVLRAWSPRLCRSSIFSNCWRACRWGRAALR